MSLGGVRDEAEIRGHRRTYIGSMPGKVIQSMKKAKKVQPAVPSRRDRQDGSGLPRRPVVGTAGGARSGTELTFNDHYLEVDYDLSNVMFVTTANTLNIPAPLMDRMEIIRIAGYTEDEKLEIARRHLLPKQSRITASRERSSRSMTRRCKRDPPLHARSGRAELRSAK
jgi:ATP-dependent Lon protease